jgi:hypothetical protein
MTLDPSELERAVELAQSGEYAALRNLIRRLREEGYSATSLLDLLLEVMSSSRHASSSGHAPSGNASKSKSN